MKHDKLNIKDKLVYSKWMFILIFLTVQTTAFAQQYTGMSGLIHVPSADMDDIGDVRVGAHFLSRKFTPDSFKNKEGKYHTFSHYLSITPFSWIEIGYTCTLQKDIQNYGYQGETKMGYYFKDRYFSVKLQPLKEEPNKWWPSIAFGTNDPVGSNNYKMINGKERNMHFSNFYVAAVKHINLSANALGVHIAYRKYKRSYNSKWNGPVGGITFQPSFQKNLRLIAEYTGNDINIGFDWKLWKHLLIQSSLQNGKYFSGGMCYQLNLF